MRSKADIAPWVDKFAYIVSGPSRSGTSMMMRTLEASGMPVDYDPSLDEVFSMRDKLRDGYDPNPHGFYEGGDVRQGFVVKRAAAMLRDVKCFIPIKMIWMDRPEAERISSIKEWGFSDDHVNILKKGSCHLLEFMIRQSRYGLDIQAIKYHDMLTEPKSELKKLQSLGWPIRDLDKGASIPSYSLYRHRANETDVSAMR